VEGKTIFQERKMNTYRQTATMVGMRFILGTVAGVLSLVFTNSILPSPDYLTRVAANQAQVILGALCVLVMGFALGLVPVVAYPIFFQET